MKKALSVLLSVLVVLSMFSVMAFAEDAQAPAQSLVTVKFVDDDGTTIIKELQVEAGTILTKYAPENPVKPDVEGKTEYTFKGWVAEDGTLYYANTLPTPDGSDLEVIFTASYSAKDVSGFQSLWNLIESIFERINLIFQYFATIFGW